ncbi:hypothetical protein [Streptomyces sp. NPDC002044]|uniref:hypothetical protein n=1 Tax=Streptomyces sp. NPDC002044 TaxID=3154662 RepID=UPI0033343FE3
MNVWRAAAMVAFTALAVVGCTPAPRALIAVERTESGHARVLTAGCPEYVALQFSVSSSGGSVGHKRWAISSGAMGGPLDTVDVFSTPSGWRAYRSDLSDLKGGSEYTVAMNGAVRGRGLDGHLSFAPDQFEALKAGEVLVTEDGETEVVSRSDFLKKDDRRCAPG